MMKEQSEIDRASGGVIQEQPRRYGFILLFIFVAGLFAIGTVFHIAQYTKVLATSDEIHALEERLTELKDSQKRLEMKKSEVYDYSVLYGKARDSGMIYPTEREVYWLKSELSVREQP